MARPPLRETGPYVVAHDPDAGCWFDVDGIPGDVITPAVLSFDDDGTGVHRVIATRRRGNPRDGVWVIQAHEVTILDADATNDESASAGRAVRSRPASERAGGCCLSATYPPAPKVKGRGKKTTNAGSVEAQGTYRVFARIRKTVPDAQAEVWLTYGDRDTMTDRRRVRVEEGPSIDWWYYDLGLIQLAAVAGLPVAELPLSLHVRDLDDQPGGIEVDHFVPLPADAEMCWVQTRPTGVKSTIVLDGPRAITYRVNAAGAVIPGGGAHHIGGLVHLGVKGRTTRVFMLTGLHGGAPAPLTGSTEVTVAYRGKHLVVAQFDEADRP